jgi:DNA-binding CsgD family transcriptional regulator
MRQTRRLGLRDFERIHRLVGECRELGDDPTVWRHRLCQGFHELVGAGASAPGEVSGFLRGPLRTPGATYWTAVGIDFGRLGTAYGSSIQSAARRSDLLRSLRQAVRRDGPASFLRRRLVPDREWFRSWEAEFYRDLMGFSDHLCTALPIAGEGGDAFSAVHMHRMKGESPFGERDQRLVQALHAAVAPLIGGPLASYTDPSPAALPPRVRQVLRLLLEGEGDKQIGAALRISPHTVNQYVKVIFSHFRVGSRPELLARWIRRGWNSRAAWC